MTSDEALDAIAAAMSGREWDADCVERVAEIVRATGRVVADVDEDVSWMDDAGGPATFLDSVFGSKFREELTKAVNDQATILKDTPETRAHLADADDLAHRLEGD